MFEGVPMRNSAMISPPKRILPLRMLGRIVRGHWLPKFAWSLLAIILPGVPVFGQQTKPSEPNVRQCTPDSDDSAGKKKPARSAKGKNRSESPSTSQACLEVRVTALAAQEYLQKYVREKRWDVTDEQTTEDTWTFSLRLKKEDLGEYTKPLSNPKMEWRGGKALVHLRTSELPDGYTRVVVTARFDGYGEPEDKFAPKRESWSLQSNGALESALMTALGARFETNH